LGAVLLGILIAASYGSGVFVGGRASNASSTAAVIFVSQALSIVGAGVLVGFVSAHFTSADLAYGGLAGAVNVIGLGLLYFGLAHYSAAVVAPIAAVLGAFVPTAWGLVHGERPSALVFMGIILALGAVALIAGESGASIRLSIAGGAAHAAAAGIALGSSVVFYSETSPRSGQYPLLAARCSSFALAAIAVWWLRRRGAVQFPTGSARALAIAAGAFDVAATALLVVAVRNDLLSVVAPVISLAPGFTVVLAWRIAGEHLNLTQRIGLVVALGGLALIAAG
jgi:drug/metabolite transporter (DMT)-like permease